MKEPAAGLFNQPLVPPAASSLFTQQNVSVATSQPTIKKVGKTSMNLFGMDSAPLTVEKIQPKQEVMAEKVQPPMAQMAPEIIMEETEETQPIHKASEKLPEPQPVDKEQQLQHETEKRIGKISEIDKYYQENLAVL